MSFVQTIIGGFKKAITGLEHSFESLDIPAVGEKAYSAEDPNQLLGTVTKEIREDLPINPHGLPDRVALLEIESIEGGTISRHPNDVITESLAIKLVSEGAEQPDLVS